VHTLPQEARRIVLQRVTQVLAEQHGIEFAYVYGSFLDRLGFRDIDVAIWTTGDVMEPVDLTLGIALPAIRWTFASSIRPRSRSSFRCFAANLSSSGTSCTWPTSLSRRHGLITIVPR
jgi:hypothetical protein